MSSAAGRFSRCGRGGTGVRRLAPAVALRWIAVVILPLALTSCGHTNDVTGPHGRIQARVQNEFQQPVSGKTVEIRELSLVKTTGLDGIAEFTVLPDRYVVRAYDLGLPGPGRAYVDQGVLVKAGETAVADFVDCQTCVAP